MMMNSYCITQPRDPANTIVYLIHSMKKKNTVNPADSLRRVSCVRQLAGKMNTAEQLNNRRNRDNYFITSLSAHNAIFVERLIAHFTNQKMNKKV